MSENYLSYTSLTYESIMQAIKDKIDSDSRFQNFKESQIAQTLFEIFAGAVDLCNYNLERRAEENYFDTAKLRSSVILLAKQLGYSTVRPIPAEAKIKVKISGDLTSKNINTGDVLQIPIYNNFTFENNNYLLKETFSYTFTSANINSISADTDNFELIITSADTNEEIYVIQGERKTKVIEGETNNQVGQNFQIYKIEDKDFSNKYGEEDYDIKITTVGVGKTSAAAVDYSIDRRSLINLESIENFVKGDEKKVCVIRTSNDENIEILFGDAQYAALGATVSANGPVTTYDNIYVKYLSTKGSKANKTGLIDKKLTNDVSITINGDDITDNVEFLFNGNIIGGADMEDIDSIKLNAPSLFYSLDRLVTKRDYIAYLKSLTSPINIKNAIVWGEQDEMNLTDDNPIKKLFNVVLFCALGSLYNLDGDNYSVRTKENNLDNSVLDIDFDETELNNQNYFNVYVKQNIVQQLLRYETSGIYHVLFGSDDANIDITDFSTKYHNWPFNFTYNSDRYLSGTSLIRSTSALDLSAITTCADIATSLQNGLRGYIDIRGSSAINSNYNSPAFSGISVSYDNTNDRFIISGSPDESCYIVNTHDSGFTRDMGINAKYSSRASKIISNNQLMSEKITSVIDKLDVRSQVTTKNIYISPLIQGFNLIGNIYVKQLADKTDLHRKIKNKIYTWLDKNADFNVNIYLSNIIDIIEDFPNVHHANVQLSASPVVYTPFNATTNTILNKPLYADEVLLKIKFTAFDALLLARPSLTSREFFEEVSTLYDGLSSDSTNHTPFRDTVDFITVVSDIYKNHSLEIKTNMIDTNGNITNYSIGTEIAKVNLATTSLYYSG